MDVCQELGPRNSMNSARIQTYRHVRCRMSEDNLPHKEVVERFGEQDCRQGESLDIVQRSLMFADPKIPVQDKDVDRSGHHGRTNPKAD